MNNAMLVTNPTNIRYLTGFVFVERGDAWLVLAGGKKHLITNSLYEEEAKKLDCEAIVSSNFVESAEKLEVRELEFEENDLTVAEYKKFSVKMIPTQRKIETMRMIKRKDEIENIRRAAKITKECFAYIKKLVKPGVTEAGIARDIENFCRSRAGDVAFSPIVAFNGHASRPHYSGRGTEPLQKNGFVLLDFGARVNGYASDMTRMVFLGKQPPAYEIVQKAQEKVFSLLRRGERNGATLDAAAKEVIAEAGLPPYPHSLGHNIGLDVHEAPRLSVKKPATLLPGMVFSVEPGVYVEGQYGIRIEDTVLLKENGMEILT